MEENQGKKHESPQWRLLFLDTWAFWLESWKFLIIYYILLQATLPMDQHHTQVNSSMGSQGHLLVGICGSPMEEHGRHRMDDSSSPPDDYMVTKNKNIWTFKICSVRLKHLKMHKQHWLYGQFNWDMTTELYYIEVARLKLLSLPWFNAYVNMYWYFYSLLEICCWHFLSM